MPSDRLSDTSADRVARSRIGWLTVLRPGGSPHTTPVWFVLESGTLWIATGISSVKVGCLESDPRVSLAVDGTADAPLVAEGEGHLVERKAAPGIAAMFSQKYGWDIDDDSVDGVRVLIRIRVSRWLLTG